jgi:sialic acid synthase SpsE
MLNIAGQAIVSENRPYIIAEMSGNHNQSLERAIALVDAAADAGAHAIKLQTFTAETMTLDVDRSEFQAAPGSLWTGRSLYSLYAKAPWLMTACWDVKQVFVFQRERHSCGTCSLKISRAN